MKLAFLTLAASAVGAVLVTASNAADRQMPMKMTDRAEVVQLAEVSSCEPPPGAFTCGRPGHPPDGRPDGRPPRGPNAGRPGPFPPEPGFGPGPLMLASRLSAMETLIGVNADQLAAWRAYTDALQTVASPPPPPGERAVPADALAQSAALAGQFAEKGRQATKLAAAIEALRTTLTAEQLARLAEAGPLLPPRPPFGGPPPFAPASFGPSGPGGPGSGQIPPP